MFLTEGTETAPVIASGKLVYACVNGGRVGDYGRPRNTTLYKSEYYIDVLDHFDIVPDFVLDDGRYRVAVALKIVPQIKDETILMVHDFNNRGYYWEIEQFYDSLDHNSSDNVVFEAFTRKKSFNQEKLESSLLEYRKIMLWWGWY